MLDELSQLGGVTLTALVLTVSIVSENQLQNELSDHQLTKISYILDDLESLRVKCGDNAEILFTGYVTLLLQLGTNPDMQLDVLFLVVPEKLPQPIIGFNVEMVIADRNFKGCS